MNWTDLNEINRRALSKEMTVKEASDFISMSWHLINFHDRWKEMYPEYETEHKKLIDLSIAVYKRAHEKE